MNGFGPHVTAGCTEGCLDVSFRVLIGVQAANHEAVSVSDACFLQKLSAAWMSCTSFSRFCTIAPTSSSHHTLSGWYSCYRTACDTPKHPASHKRRVHHTEVHACLVGFSCCVKKLRAAYGEACQKLGYPGYTYSTPVCKIMLVLTSSSHHICCYKASRCVVARVFLFTHLSVTIPSKQDFFYATATACHQRCADSLM